MPILMICCRKRRRFSVVSVYSTLSIQFIFHYQNRHIKLIESFIKQQSVTNFSVSIIEHHLTAKFYSCSNYV